jgi:Electron transfer DM13
MSKRKLVIAAVLIAGGVAWYAFRPERLFINKTVSESLPAAASAAPQPLNLESGNFHDGAHKTSGVATILQLPDGKRTLRLTDFATSNGPDVHVYLVAAGDATDSETVKKAGFVDLGSIKGNIGDQNYDVPSDIDLNKYRAVTIWCARFNVNFGTAPLSVQSAGGSTGASPKAVVAGTFHEGAHKTSGMATIYQLEDGKRILRLTNFATSNGPDVHVYLVAASDVTDSATVKKAGFVDLGSIKGNVGDQNYEVPSDADLSKYQAVAIWCARFGVNFGTAPLTIQN